MLFAPWVIFRSVGIYDNDFLRGLQFSSQARFALDHQWDTPAELKINPSLKLMGLGTACAVDKPKCTWLSDRQTRILAGTLPVTIDDEMNLSAKEAIKTLLESPLAWMSIKLEFFGQSYFQKSVYDSIDSKYHFSLDLVLVILFIPLIILLILRMQRSPRKFFIIACLSSSLFLATQLLITQSLLRFFLPSISLLVVSLVLAMHVEKVENRIRNQVPKGKR